jgi:hypothetical protein
MGTGVHAKPGDPGVGQLQPVHRRDRDGLRVKPIGPGHHLRIRLGAHQLRDHVGVKHNHRAS